VKLGVRAATLPCPGTHAQTSCSMPCLARCSLWTLSVIATAVAPASAALAPLTRGTALRETAAAVSAGLDISQCAGALLAATPPALHYTAAVLRANDAARRGDAGGWVDCINAMLVHWNTSGVRLLSRAASLPGGGSGGSREHDGLGISPSPAIDFISDLAPVVPPPPIQQPPLISVIMVAHNAHKTVAAACASILAQTWRGLELVIVDDASTDGTWSAVTAICGTDPARVRLLRNRRRVGPYVSRNRALRDAVSGDYVTCHDADDWAHPDRLAVQVGPLVASRGMLRASLAYMLRVQPDGRLSTEALSWFCPDGATKVAMVSAMYERRLLVDELGYWDGVWYGADAEMIGRAQALLGKASFAEVRAIAMLCRDAAAGLGKAGYNDAQTVADDRWTNSTRHRYRDAFSAWHARVATSRNAYLPFHHHKARLFMVPDGMAVDERAIRAIGVRAGLRE